MTRRRRSLLVATAAFALLLAGAWRLHDSRTVQLFGDLVSRVETDAPLVALTFDDGPTPEGTAAILAVLDSLDVRATFFVTGREMEVHPEWGRRLVDAGHALGNHSYSHPLLLLRSPSFVRREIEATEAQIRAAGWEGPVTVRPPYGKRLVVLPWVLDRSGRTTLMWDVEPESFPEVAARAETIAAHVEERARPGSIILLHVMYPTRAESLRAVPLIVERLRARGLRFVTVPELMAEA